MSKDAPRREVRDLEKRLTGRLKRVSANVRGVEPGLEDHLLSSLMSGGPELPSSARRDSLKAVYMERGRVLQQLALEAGQSHERPKKRVGVRARPALARIAAVAAAVILVVAGLSLGSAYAMPGNPLYSVKRAAESIYLSAVPGDQNKADAYAAWTSRRLDDLKYVEERGMADWYYGLTEDAQGGIEGAFQHGKRLRAGASQSVTQKAQALTLRLEALLRIASANMTPAEKARTEGGMERLRLQLRMRQGNPSGPSQENGQPGNQNGQQNGSSSGPGTQQQQQQNQEQQQQQQQQQQQNQNQQTIQVPPTQFPEQGDPNSDQGNQGQQSPPEVQGSNPTSGQGSRTDR